MIADALAATLAVAITLATASSVEPSAEREDPVITRHDTTRADGTPVWSLSASYELSTGDVAEVYMEVDGAGVGETELAINGEVIARTQIDDIGGEPAVTTWTGTTVDYPPEVLTEAMEAALADDVLRQMIPQAFPCSEYGKKAVKATKYLWIAATEVMGAVCCIGGVGVGCIACAVGAGVAQQAGVEGLENHCD